MFYVDAFICKAIKIPKLKNQLNLSCYPCSLFVRTTISVDTWLIKLIKQAIFKCAKITNSLLIKLRYCTPYLLWKCLKATSLSLPSAANNSFLHQSLFRLVSLQKTSKGFFHARLEQVVPAHWSLVSVSYLHSRAQAEWQFPS